MKRKISELDRLIDEWQDWEKSGGDFMENNYIPVFSRIISRLETGKRNDYIKKLYLQIKNKIEDIRQEILNNYFGIDFINYESVKIASNVKLVGFSTNVTLDYQYSNLQFDKCLLTQLSEHIEELYFNNSEVKRINWVRSFNDFANLINELKSKSFILGSYDEIANCFLIEGEMKTGNQLKDRCGKNRNDQNYQGSDDIKETLNNLKSKVDNK